MQRLDDTCNAYGLKVNLKKAKFMIITKSNNVQANLVIDGILVEIVESEYKYLGKLLDLVVRSLNGNQGTYRNSNSIAFIKIKKFLCSRNKE